MAISLEERDGGFLVAVRAQPGARVNAIKGEHNGRLKVGVTQVAEKGKANAAIAALLARSLGLKSSRVTLIEGETSREKRFLVSGLTRDQLLEKIAALLAHASR